MWLLQNFVNNKMTSDQEDAFKALCTNGFNSIYNSCTKKKNKNIFFICMIIRNLDKPLDTKFMPDWGAIASTSAISL